MGTKVTPLFSPSGVGAQDRRHDLPPADEGADRGVDPGQQGATACALLQAPRTFKRGTQLDLVWDGFTDSGIVVPDGVYMPVVKLAPLAPHDRAAERDPARHEAAGDHRAPPAVPDPLARRRRTPRLVHASPTGSASAAHAILAVRGTQVEFTRSQKQVGELHWTGKLGKPPKPVRPGRYLLTVAARDEAGNQSKAFPFAIAQVRYITLARDRVVVRPGGQVLRAARVGRHADRALDAARPLRRRSAPARCISGRRSRQASTACTSPPAHTRRSARWSSHEQRCRTGRRRARRARAAHC